jgi:hypothetical protein
MKYLIIEYNKNSTRHFHITKIFDELVENHAELYNFLSFDELKNNSNNDTDLKNFFINKYNEIPEFIIGFSGVGSFFPIYKTIIKLTKLVFIIDDIHHAKSIRKSRIPVINNSEIIFCSYSYQFTRWGLEQPKNLYFFPHSVRWVCEFNELPINKILISGRVSDIYPDRQYAQNIALKNSNIFDILQCNISYETKVCDDNKIYGKKFYDYLNKYLCCFVDTARDYILAKTFEICGSGSLLLCMDTNVKNIMGELGFIDGINYVSCNQENFIEKSNWICDLVNRELIDKIRKNGHELIKNNHTWKNRMKFMREIIEKK